MCNNHCDYYVSKTSECRVINKKVPIEFCKHCSSYTEIIQQEAENFQVQKNLKPCIIKK